MFKFVPVRSQLREVQKKNVLLEQETRQTRADLDFVAVMADLGDNVLDDVFVLE